MFTPAVGIERSGFLPASWHRLYRDESRFDLQINARLSFDLLGDEMDFEWAMSDTRFSFKFHFLPAVFFFISCGSLQATENYNLPLWDLGEVPLSKGKGPLDHPLLTVFEAPADKRNGSSVIIAPGGSNIMLMYGAEGIEIAERFNQWGATAFVLTYRMSPTYDHDARILDGNRAIRLVKHRADQWGLDPERIHFIGFSAGGSLARYVGANTTAGDPGATDPVERESSKPHSLGLVYGTGQATPSEDLSTFPPTYIITAAADNGNRSAQLFMDINDAGGIAELHIPQQGRHGFGAAFSSPEFKPWMDSLKHFSYPEWILWRTA